MFDNADIVSALESGQVRRFYHPEQNGNVLRQRVVLNYLLKAQLIKQCVTTDDLRAIQRAGVEFFRRHFPGGNQKVHAWGSYTSGSVPYLVEEKGSLEIQRAWMSYDSNAECVALARAA